MSDFVLRTPTCAICIMKPIPEGEARYDYNNRLFEHFDRMNSRDQVEQHEYERCRWLGLDHERATFDARLRGQKWEEHRQRREAAERMAEREATA